MSVHLINGDQQEITTKVRIQYFHNLSFKKLSGNCYVLFEILAFYLNYHLFTVTHDNIKIS